MTAALMDYDEIVRGLKASGVPDAAAERAAADEIARRSANDAIRTALDLRTPLVDIVKRASIEAENGANAFDGAAKSQSKTLVHVGADRFAICRSTLAREFDVFTATFELPPRTKKNSRRFLFKESAAYTRFRNAIIEAVRESAKELALPLPDQPYNLAARFYVDKPGERADLFGLLQGIADALENAGVVRDDWHFRTVDRSEIIAGDECPRVELTITPIEA